jgi:hypothetical protein
MYAFFRYNGSQQRIISHPFQPPNCLPQAQAGLARIGLQHDIDQLFWEESLAARQPKIRLMAHFQ